MEMMILNFHYSCNICKAFRNRGAEHSKNAGIKRSKAHAYCCYELCTLCKDGLLILDTSTVTPIFTLEPPFVFAGDVPMCAWLGIQSGSSRTLLPFFVLLVLRPTQLFNQGILKVKGSSAGRFRCLTLKAKASFYGLLLRHWILSFCGYFIYIFYMQLFCLIFIVIKEREVAYLFYF